MEGFRFLETPFRPRRMPDREELRAFYNEILTIEGKLYFLLYAMSELKKRAFP